MQKSINKAGYLFLILFSFVFIGKVHSGIFYPVYEPTEDEKKPAQLIKYNIDPGSDTTWDFPRTIVSDNLVVDSGAVLTITSSVFFANNRKLIVKRGGKLVLDGGRLSNTCDQVWQGIELWGTTDYPPDSVLHHGQVVLKPGALIENAEYGIRTIRVYGDPTEGENYDFDYAGGIVKANNATFRNCKYVVQFYPYNFENQSGFTKVTFETTDSLLYYQGVPVAGVHLNEVKGIDFKACTFRNTLPFTEVDLDERGMGIYSFESDFWVQPHCSGTTIPCPDSSTQPTRFERLYYGIKAKSATSNATFRVDSAVFNNNIRGLYAGAVDNLVVLRSDFTTYENSSPLIVENYGLYIDECTGFTIEENHFHNDQSLKKGIGLIANNVGGDPNEIYRNRFTGLQYGILAQNENRDKTGEGLVLRCNKYDETKFDKVITWEGLFMNTRKGIAKDQGSSASNPEAMAGNLFQDNGPPYFDDYDDILNEANSIIYYYPQNFALGYNNVVPKDYTANVTLENEEVEPDDWTFENGCPPDETGTGGGGSEEELRGSIAQTNLAIDSTENLLALLIDGGNTEATQTDIETSIPPETMQVYNDLMSKSPYLSDTVVSTAIEKEDVLPGAMIRDIMVANPNTAKSESLMNKLDERWDPLPEYMKAQILQGRSIVSIREESESVLAARKLEKAKYINALVRLYLEDTLNPQVSIDSLNALLEQEHNITAKYRLAMLSLEQGVWSAGLGVLNNIPAQFELTASEANEHQQFTALYNLLSNISQQGKTVFEADSTTMVSLLEIEASNSGLASTYARNVLLALDQMEYEEPILLPDMLKAAIVQDAYNSLISKANEAPGYIHIKPNPAKDYIIVAYELEQETAASIDINDIAGNPKEHLNVSNRQDEVTVNTQDWKPGIYFATLKINGKLIESLKFTIGN